MSVILTQIDIFLTLCSSEVQGLSVVCWLPSAALFPKEDKKTIFKDEKISN